MNSFTISYFKKFFFPLLLLISLFLPAFEAPKNIFLYSFLIISFFTHVIFLIKNKLIYSDYIFLVLIVSALLSTFFSGMHVAEYRGLRIFLSSALFCWIVSNINFKDFQRTAILASAVLSTFFTLFFGIISFLYIHSKPDLQLNSVGHVNHSAIYLTMIFGLILGYTFTYWETLKNHEKFIAVFLSYFFMYGIMISESRAAYGVSLFLSIILIRLFAKNFNLKVGAICSLICIIFFSVILDVKIIQKNNRNIQSHDVLAQRDRVWNISFEAMQWHPILGIGINNWGKIKPADIRDSVVSRGETFDEDKYLFQGHSHSLYLTYLVERGVVGFLSLILFMVFWFYSLIHEIKSLNLNRQKAFLWSISFSAWITTFGIGFVNTTFHHEHGILASLLLGLYLSFLRFSEK